MNIHDAPGGKIIVRLNHNDKVQVVNVGTNWTILSSNKHAVYVLTSTVTRIPAARPEYIVKLGGSLWAIANSHGTTIQALKTISHLTSARFIRIRNSI
ncbi:LysM peptidoglycan-binding domain-containing protein [Sporolactobacillus pectinivorans]|uniref:LysM peptidoglycan-binding domain-containing protein n=1 Tax=Sporolactobacillus pectinivorans TaxID=1591408 RepID=UPI0012FD60C4|nr:LysM peptidoglycan-binding domain-containing protein [Sporolactobacillus pectinivorans]